MAGFSIDKFVHDKEAPHDFERPRFFVPRTESVAAKETRTHASSGWPPRSPSLISNSTALTRADTGSSTKSRATTVSEATSMSTAPSFGFNPPAPTLDQQILSMSIHDPDHPCIFHGILECHAAGLNGFDAWSEHHIDHFGARGPPSHARCVFCEEAFDATDALDCWAEYLKHTYDHLENGKRLDDRRPDFRVLRDLREKGVLSADDYDHLCTGTERPPMGTSGATHRLMPLDWEPPETVSKRTAAAAAANRVPVPEPRRERRDRRQRPRTTAGEKKQHSPKVVQL